MVVELPCAISREDSKTIGLSNIFHEMSILIHCIGTATDKYYQIITNQAIGTCIQINNCQINQLLLVYPIELVAVAYYFVVNITF